MSEKKKAFLYGRVSTTTQAESGQGLERQLKSALKFLSEYPEYEVDNTNIIQDKGVSAYSGDNIADSAGLGGFLTAVRQGLIPRESLLVIEAPDRLSRLGIRKGQRLFDEFADHGINVGLVRYGTIIRHDDDNDFKNSLIVSIGLYLGHLESQQKSERIRDTMGKRREKMRSGKLKSTTHRPSWLDPKEDGTGFEFNDFAEVVRLMFELRLKGLGGHKIAKWLAENGYTDTEGEPIRFQRVSHYLRSKATIGYYQPHEVTKVKGKRVNEPSGEPITDFYPQLVSEEDFYEVQRLLDSSSGGRRDQFTNYLRDLVRCELCEHKFTTVVVKGRNNEKYTYHKCFTKTSHGKPDIPKSCESKAVNHKLVETYVLPVLQKLNYVALVNETVIDQAEVIRITSEIEQIEAVIAENRQALNYLKGAARGAVESVINNDLANLYDLKKKLDGEASGSSGASDDAILKLQGEIHENALDTPEKRMEFNAKLKLVIETLTLEKENWGIQFKGDDFHLKIDYKHKDPVSVIENFYQNRSLLADKTLSEEAVENILSLPVQ
jgi:DNA invertase Pin-like site-specific DNA recombinase